MPDASKLTREAVRIIQETGGGLVRLMGSVALAVRCSDSLFLWDALGRDPAIDIDLVTLPANEALVRGMMPGLGYLEEPGYFYYRRAAYNRLGYFNPTNEALVEIFIDPLPFHHTIAIDARFSVDPITVSLADLFMLKIQYERIQKRQLVDLCLLLVSHEVSRSSDSGISLTRIVQLVQEDWGLWRTSTINIKKLAAFVRRELIGVDAGLGALASSRIDEIAGAIQEIAKDGSWKMRDALHKACPCIRIGRPIDDPTEDRWGNYRRE